MIGRAAFDAHKLRYDVIETRSQVVNDFPR
jgi:hypothetical protein